MTRNPHAWLGLAALTLLAACATRPINPPIDRVDSHAGYRYVTRPAFKDKASDSMIVLAFSGGGTRAAAFSYGVLEELRRTPVTVGGEKRSLLDEVDIVTGVSGGSFTALAYALYGDRLFDVYEQAFLKRDVEHDLIARFLNPFNWTRLWSESWGRSELAAQLYDEILFHGATFADLQQRNGPLAMVTATDISTGSRLAFVQSDFDVICSDVSAVPLSRAAAASSAVPFALSPVTLNNYGGTCGYREPAALVREAGDAGHRPAGRALAMLRDMRSFEDGADRPYIHLVDGGISDNLGVRAMLETFEQLEASVGYQRALRIDEVRRIAVFVVNSASDPRTDWDRHERPPNDVQILIKATGVPIDRYSYEAVELLKDVAARWDSTRALRAAGVFANAGNPALARAAARVPNIDIYAINVAFDEVPGEAERRYLKDLPTSFALPPEAVDRLRAAAGAVLRASSDFQRLVRELSAAKAPEPLGAPVEIR
ncbi:MAG TPA: patatin-like phospholipase family protein [Casimicrobiaceae bacterium]|nr:patatin-like phospholipase family protein [Casimicrobiaceae bacterium]